MFNYWWALQIYCSKMKLKCSQYMFAPKCDAVSCQKDLTAAERWGDINSSDFQNVAKKHF